MKYEFIGPPNPGPDGEDLGHDIVAAGTSLGNVKPGGVLEVPDELAEQVVFSEELWKPVAASRKKGGS